MPSLGRIVRLGGAAGTPPVDRRRQRQRGHGRSQQRRLHRDPQRPLVPDRTVNYTTVNGTAIAGIDYSTRSGTLSFPAGTTTRTITVPTIADSLIESNETFNVRCRGPPTPPHDDTGTGTIVDDDVPLPPTLIVNSVGVTEGSSGTPVAASR